MSLVTGGITIYDTENNTCLPQWNCSQWSRCNGSFEIKVCEDLNNCTDIKPVEKRKCEIKTTNKAEENENKSEIMDEDKEYDESEKESEEEDINNDNEENTMPLSLSVISIVAIIIVICFVFYNKKQAAKLKQISDHPKVVVLSEKLENLDTKLKDIDREIKITKNKQGGINKEGKLNRLLSYRMKLVRLHYLQHRILFACPTPRPGRLA